MSATVRRHDDQQLRPDADRVIGRLFLPSIEPPHVHRTHDLVRRMLDLDDATASQLLTSLLGQFSRHHPDLKATLRSNAAVVAPRHEEISDERLLLLGAAFTSEYTVEGAALCNPSVIPHPDQPDGAALRVAVSLRGIGEGHLSALEFASATISDGEWVFDERLTPLHAGSLSHAPVPRDLFAALVATGTEADELTTSVLAVVPEQVEGSDVERVLIDLPPDLLLHPEAHVRVQELRRRAGSVYTVSFPAGTDLSQRVLAPAAEDERQGIEDARFTLFRDDDGTATYRASYTAYDGRTVSNRLLVSADLSSFTSFPLTGPGARNKGMALFPRRVGGRYLALSRADGMTIGVTASEDGYRWEKPQNIEGPRAPWQILQMGNGGTPLETQAGWLVVTHGVGVMRSYSLGVILLDREDPTRVIGRLDRALLPPVAHAGYVPNVVFTCGSIIHQGRLFVPYGIGDLSISVASVSLDELLAELVA
ncbi:MAG: hypothetical protein ACOH16_03825 [Propionibacteriaceae bacterium]